MLTLCSSTVHRPLSRMLRPGIGTKCLLPLERTLCIASICSYTNVHETIRAPSTSSALWSLQIARNFAVTGRKSKNVAAKKNKMDAAKTKLFTRLGVKILMAAKRGGVDPTKNPDLSRALKEAHSVKLPKDNIERALKKASDAGNTEDYRSGDYEVFGLGGVGLIVQSLTDNTNRANMTIKAAARKADVKMASSGSVIFQFDLKGVLEIKGGYDEEKILEIALDAGVDEVDFYAQNRALRSELEGVTGSGDDAIDADTLRALYPPLILTNPESLGALQDALEANISSLAPQSTASAAATGTGSVADAGREVYVTGSLGYIPKELVLCSEEDYERNLEIIEQFEELDDVDIVYHNMKLF